MRIPVHGIKLLPGVRGAVVSALHLSFKVPIAPGRYAVRYAILRPHGGPEVTLADAPTDDVVVNEAGTVDIGGTIRNIGIVSLGRHEFRLYLNGEHRGSAFVDVSQLP